MQEVAAEVDAYEGRREVAYLVVVLHFADGHVVHHEVGDEGQGGVETYFYSEVDRGCRLYGVRNCLLRPGYCRMEGQGAIKIL